jgi:hypothetical protein
LIGYGNDKKLNKKVKGEIMKTYQELTEEQKSEAREIALNELLKAICEGYIRFNDSLNGDDLQARIDAAGDKAEAMRTPWFTHEYIMDTCREDLEAMAAADAEDSLYPEKEERVIYLKGE